jgi:DNA-binding transcriptional LysR family regulator
MLNLDQIHIFLSVARHLHFSRAAEELYISQPAVSATISKLETQAGLALFHRIGRRVQLTDAGRYLQREGHRLLEQAQRLERGLQDYNELRRGRLQLGASFTVGNYWLPRHLAVFRARHPGIDVYCELANATTILDGTEAGKYDLGILCANLPKGVEASVVGEERLILVVGPSHPWFGKTGITTEELLQGQWLMREPGSGTRQMLERCFERIGLNPALLSIHQVLHSSEMLKAMACAGPGVTALPASMVSHEITLGLLWPLKLVDHTLGAEPIWMIRSPHRQNSRLLSSFEALLKGAQQHGDP